ncbi:MAG: hypothetical protein ABI726_01725 [bacterium]
MKRLTMIGACAVSSLALVGVSGAAASNHGGNGNGGHSAAAKQCAAQKKADKQAFNAFYGKHAMRNCIKGGPVEPTVHEFKNAAKECKAERAVDPEVFQATYGANANGRNALGKCVSSKVKHAQEEDPA